MPLRRVWLLALLLAGSLCWGCSATSGGASRTPVDGATTTSRDLPELLRTAGPDALKLGPDFFVSLDVTEEKLGWPLLRSQDGAFGLDDFTAKLITSADGVPHGVRLPYYADELLRNELVFVQAVASVALPAPSSSARAERIGSFATKIWIRDDGWTAALFPTDASAGSEPVLGFVSGASGDQVRAFLQSLRFGP